MNDKSEDKLSKIGKILLGVFIFINTMCLGLVLILTITGRCLWWDVLINVIPLIVLIPAVFMVRKYPIAVGTIFMGCGVMLIGWMNTDPIYYASDSVALLYIGPPTLLFLLTGFILLIRGLLRRRNKEKEVAGQQLP